MGNASLIGLPAAALLPLALSLLAGRPFIAWLKRINAGQRVRDDGPQRHLQKEGTPTMGGLMMVGALLFTILLAVAFLPAGTEIRLRLLYLSAIAIAFGAIGFADDWLKIARGRSLGLKARHKLLWQIVAAVVFVGAAGLVSPSVRPMSVAMGAVWVVLFVATSNAMNLADGLDGLAAGLCIIACVGFLFLAGRIGHPTVLAFGLVLLGACLGFLWFNRHPARLFMGDVGSLALGGALVGMAMMLRTPVALVGLCLVPFAEAASVVMQVISFKTTGKRVFKMSPLHHHFELSGWPEQRVVWTFWTVGLLAAAATVALRLDRWQWW
jgi:phospho-N-acetylmuramoyl-pentapeptide-transferase